MIALSLSLPIASGLAGGGATTMKVSSVSPAVVETGYTLDLTINGRLFVDGATVDFGDGVTVNNVTFVDETELTANVTIAIGAAAGFRSVTVTNPDTSEHTRNNAVRVYEYAHRSVSALNTPLRRSGDLGLSDGGYFTAAVRFRIPNTTGTRDLIHIADGGGNLLMWLRISTTSLLCTAFDGSSVGFANKSIGTISADTWYTAHIAASKDGSGTVKVWLDGSAGSDSTFALGAGNFPWTNATSWTLLASSDVSPASRFDGDIAFLYFRAGTTSDAYMTDPSVFYDANGDVPLDSLAADATILFGGRQSADALDDDTTKGWNAGHNQGAGGDFALTYGEGTEGYFRDIIPSIDGEIVFWLPFDKRDMLALADTGVGVVGGGTRRTLEKSEWDALVIEDPVRAAWNWDGDPAIPYTTSGTPMGETTGATTAWDSEYTDLRMYGYSGEGDGRPLDYENKSYLSITVIRENNSDTINDNSMIHDAGLQVGGGNHVHEWDVGFGPSPGSLFGTADNDDLAFVLIANLPQYTATHLWPAQGNGLRDRTVGTVHKFAQFWSHQTQRIYRIYQKNDEAPLVNVSDPVTVNPAAAGGSYLHGFGFGGQRFGDCFLEFDNAPWDWDDGAEWMFDHWEAGDKRIYPRWEQ